MSILRLVTRSLVHYRRTGIAAVAGLAVASAVIVGSLVIGDSVRGSIRETALSRLGKIDYAFVSPHFFRQKLAGEVRLDQHVVDKVRQVVPAAITRGSATNQMSDATVPSVSVIGVYSSFWSLFDVPAPNVSGRYAAVSASLARDLGVKKGDSILVNVDRQSAVPSGTLFEHRSPDETVESLRLQISAVLSDSGVGGFKLDAGTEAPRNVFVSANWLLSQMGKDFRANALLVDSNGEDILQDLDRALQSSCSIADYGLKTIEHRWGGYLSLQSEGMLLTDSQVDAARKAASEAGAECALTSVYLATEIRKEGQSGGIPYSIVAAVEPLDRFVLQEGQESGPGPGSVWLNNWAVADLRATPGDEIELVYLVSAPDGTYTESSITLTLTGIVEMTGPAVDRGIVPLFEGITDANRIDEWSAPFPVELDRIRPQDESYWENYKATPKAFINLNTARELWNTGSAGPGTGWVTSVRLRPNGGDRWTDVSTLNRVFSRAMESELRAADAGLVFRPVRDAALAASEGTTDFGQLFLGMSMFLVIAGAGLAGTLMRLSADRRASEVGIMMACGLDQAKVSRVLFAEGTALALAGTLLGVPLGVLYAWGILSALRTWWIGAVGTSALWLHVTPVSVLAGAAASILIGALAVYLGIAGLRRTRLLDLLAGWQSVAVLPGGSARRASAVLSASLSLAAVLVALSLAGAVNPQAAFFSSGALLLISGLAAASVYLGRALAGRQSPVSIRTLALRSASANRGRSLLVIGIIATASFMIVAVAANTRGCSRTDFARKESGTGGFALRAVSSLPIRQDFGTPAGRAALNFPPEDEEIFKGVTVFRLLLSPGEDISCLNLAKPTQPRLLGVGEDMVRRGAFTVSKRDIEPGANPWTALLQGTADGPMPVFGDADSVTWTLHSGLGKLVKLTAENGKPVCARIDGLVKGSIFAGELLASEEQFQRVHPGVSAPRYFLIEAPADKVDGVMESLRANLGDLGLEVRTTREVLNSYTRVQNTYLSVFLALGGLGLLLGTFGLVAVLLRSAFERRREFALMLASGLTTAHISRLLLLENSGLLLAGLACGTISALVAVAPHVLSAESEVSWGMIFAALAVIAAVGLVSCYVAAKRVVDGALVQALREE